VNGVASRPIGVATSSATTLGTVVYVQ
jgi:hypothetical protein